MQSNWFASTGVFGWIIVALAILLVAAGVVGAMIRVPRGVAIALLLGCQLPVFAGIAGMMIARSSADDVIAHLKAPTPADLEARDSEPRNCLFLGLGAMFVSDMAAVAALVRSKKPNSAS